MADDIRIEPRNDGRPDRAFLIRACPIKGECMWPLWRKPAEGATWQWDGNYEAPTISPSIDCKGGCGRHFTITGGIVNG